MKARANIAAWIRAAVVIAAVLFGVHASAQLSAGPTRKPTWEVLVVADPATVPTAPGAPEMTVTVRDGGVVLISSDRPVTVRVFSILGQLITQKQMSPGTVRLNMDARGIYILKADNETRRISL